MNISDNMDAGEILKRGGIASRIIALAEDISKGTFSNAMEKSGQIYELVEAASYDGQWNDKVNAGRKVEKGILTDLKSGILGRDKVAHNVDPYHS